ncbi:MAG: NADH-quinone oxidoreductase subunit N [Verrucomicrobiales bacterium]|nr:NADH-quinone oxidoreductase subunit N [Verrucomicrobiales bacterium]|tara:strand:- start:2494 stop:3975 length:1482 start_codon:yes stop_codon:yes gene_type:complete
MDYGELFRMLLPEFIVGLAIIPVLALDLGPMKGGARIYRMSAAAGTTAVACALALYCMLGVDAHASLSQSMFDADPLNSIVKAIILLLTMLTGVLSIEVRFTRNIGEYYALLLLASVGMMLMVSTENLLMLFVALELSSLSLYVLAAYDGKERAATEAGMKYFLFGGMAAAFMLFGISYIYGLTGSLELAEIGKMLVANSESSLLKIALILILVGFGFKLAVAPFHFWAPDVYQASPVGSVMLIGSASKAAGIFALAKVLYVGFGNWPRGDDGGFDGYAPLIAAIALFSMIYGNLAALAQKSVRRLLAYSAIAHSGYLLVGVLAPPAAGYQSVIFYVATYGLTTIGAFAVVAAIQGKGEDITMANLVGLLQKSPGLAISFMVFILSLAGIPPLAGFFGKFYVFAAALKGNSGSTLVLAVVVVGIAMSAVSLYYYLQLLKHVFVREPETNCRRSVVNPLANKIVYLIAFAVLLLGCMPGALMDRVVHAVMSVVR